MLSVLIPTLNYNPGVAVRSLHRQLSDAGVDFEIRVADDDPKSTMRSVYAELEKLNGVMTTIRSNNLGRFDNRIVLAREAQYTRLLFLDEDVVVPDDFIAKYSMFIDSAIAVFGGMEYSTLPPGESVKHLRWKYGKKREAWNASVRNQTPYSRLMTCNFIISKDVFLNLPRHDELQGYGHEDTMMGYDLKYAFVEVKHIDNPVTHEQIDDAGDFIRKTNEGLANLYRLIAAGKIDEDVRLYKLYNRLKKSGLTRIPAKYVERNHKGIMRRLSKENPPLRLFDLYKLGTLCGMKDIG
jgi:glycosyltransferase involved in cell wall biosynthesis